MMRRSSVTLLAAILLAAPLAAAGPWGQTSGGPARTASPPTAGPATNETAFTVQLPGALSKAGLLGPPEPLVVDGQAYVAVQPTDADDGLDGRGIATVDLATGETELLVETDRVPQYVAIDDGRLYVVRDAGMDAYDTETGEELWGTEHPQRAGDHVYTYCHAPAVARGRVYVTCTELSNPAGEDGDAPPRTHPFVWYVNATSGEHLGTSPLTADQVSDEPGATLANPDSGATASRASPQRLAVGVTVAGERAYALTVQNLETSDCGPGAVACYQTRSTSIRLWALDADNYNVVWSNRTEPQRGLYANTAGPGPYRPMEDDFQVVSARVTATDRVVYAKLDGVMQARSAADGRILWHDQLGEEDLEANTGGISSALAGEALYVASAQTLYRYDTDVEVNAWQFALDPSLEQEFTWGSVMTTGGTVYAMAHDYGDETTLYAVDADSGDEVFRHAVRPASDDYRDKTWIPFTYALGDGVVVIAGYDGRLHVVGETEASIGDPNVTATTGYPGVGEEVSVDLSGTEPGAFGEASRYKADWGDGTTTGWQSDQVLTHAYNASGNRTATFWVGNDANQTARTTETFHVGQDPPPDPNLAQEVAQTALADGNVDITFGVLGLLVAATGGAVGATRRYRKRSLLQQELDTLEQGFEDTRHDPGECEAFLDTRKGRARSLALDGKLNEEQAGIIESRAEELRRELRQGAVEEEFGFLPHELVMKARKMLEDGEVTELEAEAFLQALEDVDFLREEQEALVRERIEEWYGRDAGGGGAG